MRNTYNTFNAGWNSCWKTKHGFVFSLLESFIFKMIDKAEQTKQLNLVMWNLSRSGLDMSEFPFFACFPCEISMGQNQKGSF